MFTTWGFIGSSLSSFSRTMQAGMVFEQLGIDVGTDKVRWLK